MITNSYSINNETLAIFTAIAIKLDFNNNRGNKYLNKKKL